MSDDESASAPSPDEGELELEDLEPEDSEDTVRGGIKGHPQTIVNFDS